MWKTYKLRKQTAQVISLNIKQRFKSHFLVFEHPSGKRLNLKSARFSEDIKLKPTMISPLEVLSFVQDADIINQV